MVRGGVWWVGGPCHFKRRHSRLPFLMLENKNSLDIRNALFQHQQTIPETGLK
jgi:hypothetical protein